MAYICWQVVDTPSHSYLAAPLSNYEAVGLWHLETGDFPGYMFGTSADYCSTALVMRSRWSWGGSSWPLCGPVLMVIRGRFANFFY